MTEIKARLVASSAVASITIVEERALPDRGYFRARLTLRNNDFLEVAEYFVHISHTMFMWVRNLKLSQAGY